MYMQQMPYMCQDMMWSMEDLNKSLQLIKEAVQDEKNDAMFYEYLMKNAPTNDQKQIIDSIRNDEIKHNKMFRSIYKNITGMDLPPAKEIDFEKPKSYIDGIKKALFGELAAVEKYRIIKRGLPCRGFRDMLFEIITDEIKHSIKYNYILYLNCCENKRSYSEVIEDDFTRCDCPIYQRLPKDFLI